MQILILKFDLFRYKQLIELLYNFTYIYTYTKADHFKKKLS